MGNNEKYVIQQLSIGSILTHIQDHEIVVPEIQRPFVWNASQVNRQVLRFSTSSP